MFLRSVSSSDVTTSHLIYSKLRLAPAKTRQKGKALNIPRLELLAVLIGVRAARFVRQELGLSLDRQFIWTDSLCVQHWISSSKDLSVFVHNRLKEIRSAEGLSFRHAPSKSNPADLPTRGIDVEALQGSSLWWHGPTCMALTTPFVLASFAVCYSGRRS